MEKMLHLFLETQYFFLQSLDLIFVPHLLFPDHRRLSLGFPPFLARSALRSHGGQLLLLAAHTNLARRVHAFRIEFRVARAAATAPTQNRPRGRLCRFVLQHVRRALLPLLLPRNPAS
jgi:hypothetical protein